jgi:leucine dehydrogenase
MRIVEYMEKHGFEQLAVGTDPAVGLRAFIAIHDTTLGPACGGVRIWSYKSEEDALLDVLMLARAMTYKSAAAGLHMGGGKALVMADPHKEKNEALMRALGRFVDTLGGRFLITEDVGCEPRDLEYIAQETEHLVGLPVSMGGSGDSSVMTGYGVYMGIRACAKEVWGSDSLSGKTVAIQGFGKVASNLAPHLLKDGAQLVVSDIYAGATEKARKLGAAIASPDEIYDVKCDVFSPCALGGTVNEKTIQRLKCRVIAGGANNQLATPEDGRTLRKRGVLYGPDFIVNAGGIINASCEVGAPYSMERAKEITERIYETTQRVIAMARERSVTTAEAANTLAEERLESVRRAKRIYI